MQQWRNALQEQGFYIGDSRELIDDTDIFDQYISEIDRRLYRSDDHRYRNSIRNKPQLPMTIPYTEIEARQALIRENNWEIFQQWHEIHIADTYFRSITEKFITAAYPQTIEHIDDLIYKDSFTLYENNDFICLHEDGDNPGRLCVLLIYLNTTNTLNTGGELLIQDKMGRIHTVSAHRNNFAVLDFTRHNLSHAVAVVKNNYRRYAYICFVHDPTELSKPVNKLRQRLKTVNG